MGVAPWNDPNIRWVCEQHQDKDFEHKIGIWPFRRECAGPGMPERSTYTKLNDTVIEPITSAHIDRLLQSIKDNAERMNYGPVVRTGYAGKFLGYFKHTGPLMTPKGKPKTPKNYGKRKKI